MKKILLLILLFAGVTVAKAELPKTLIGMDVGISQKNIPMNFDFLYHKFQFGFGVDIPYNRGTKGKDYTGTINIDRFGESVSNGKFYTPFNIQFGYNIFNNLIIGIGAGVVIETLYQNSYDCYHILSDDGYYYVTEENGARPQLKVFSSYLIPFNINNRSFFKINAQYCTISKLAIGVGFAIRL